MGVKRVSGADTGQITLITGCSTLKLTSPTHYSGPSFKSDRHDSGQEVRWTTVAERLMTNLTGEYSSLLEPETK